MCSSSSQVRWSLASTPPLTRPGNPGLPDYYHKFLHNLYDQLPDSYAIITTSHVGGDPSVDAPEEPLNIYQQTTTKVEFVEALQTSLGHWAKEHRADEPKLSISAHSMGTWMTVELLKRVKGIHAAYLLFPTLGWISNSYNGWKLWVSDTRTSAARGPVRRDMGGSSTCREAGRRPSNATLS